MCPGYAHFFVTGGERCVTALMHMADQPSHQQFQASLLWPDISLLRDFPRI